MLWCLGWCLPVAVIAPPQALLSWEKCEVETCEEATWSWISYSKVAVNRPRSIGHQGLNCIGNCVVYYNLALSSTPIIGHSHPGETSNGMLFVFWLSSIQSDAPTSPQDTLATQVTHNKAHCYEYVKETFCKQPKLLQTSQIHAWLACAGKKEAPESCWCTAEVPLHMLALQKCHYTY